MPKIKRCNGITNFGMTEVGRSPVRCDGCDTYLASKEKYICIDSDIDVCQGCLSQMDDLMDTELGDGSYRES